MIPVKLLIHSVIYKHSMGMDRDRNPIYEDVTLERVRVGVTMAVNSGTIGKEKADTMTLYIDCVNSRYLNSAGESMEPFAPKELDAVEFDGCSYTIERVTPIYTQDTDAPHHYEVTLG